MCSTREGADAADIIINMTGELVDEGSGTRRSRGLDGARSLRGRAGNVSARFEGIKRRVDQLAQGLREKRQHITPAG